MPGAGRGGGCDGMDVCPQPVLTAPEAPFLKVLRRACQGVSGPAALDSGITGDRWPLGDPDAVKPDTCT